MGTLCKISQGEAMYYLLVFLSFQILAIKLNLYTPVVRNLTCSEINQTEWLAELANNTKV